ncbi:MAG: iron-sulfur cluster assembly scaffold protein [Rhodobacteraceae bacterium]|nr:iron-sulfur cluster assembly scaffold protein [Paracoccaceae bacterium]
MADSDLNRLYSGRILALAAAIPRTGRLTGPQGTARRRSPLCGSTITADVVLQEGRISEFAQDVRACALGQASAAILGEVVLGLRRADLEAARAAVQAMLLGGPAPAAPFDGYAALIPARDYRNRHGSILLALDAAAAAVAAAEGSAETG